MLRTTALACFLLAGPAVATEEAKATEKAVKPAAESKKTAEVPTPSLRGKKGASSGPGWQHFKFSTVATKGGQESDSVQVSEIYFYVNGAKQADNGVTATDPMGYSPQGQDAMMAVDNNIETKWLDFQKQPLEITYPAPISADAFTFVTGNDQDERDPESFTMEVSTDGTTWTLVSEVNGFDLAARSTETKQFIMDAADPSGAGGGGGGGGGSSDDGCGGACIFLIVFFAGGFTYFAAGFAYNYQRKELRGAEAIPQVGFWKDLPFLVKDGGMFVVGKVTGRGGYASV